MRLDPKAEPSPSTLVFFSTLLIATILTFTACGSVNAAGNVPANKDGISISASPAIADVVAGQAQQFTVAVTGTANSAVNWAVNGIAGGNASLGTVTGSGLYTAPADLSTDSTVTLAAISLADVTKSATALIRLWRPITVRISPTTVTLQTGRTQQFSASVSGTWNTGVTWSVNGVSGGNATVGMISANGLYTAPSSVPAYGSIVVTATSVAQSTRSANATVYITSSSTIAVSVSPTSSNLQTGATQQFNASVTGTTNTAVAWLVNGVQGGSSTVGTITTSGLYTAPSSLASSTAFTVTARSVADTTKSANASVTVNPPATAVAVSVSPTTSSLQAGATQQFNASVTGTTNTAVSWLVNGVLGGSSTVGTITTGGLYTAPSSLASSTAFTVTARSAADTTKTASASVTVNPPAPSVAVSVSPTAATLQSGLTQQFSAGVTGTTNTGVTWAVGGVQGGNSTVGTISASGLYTAPTVSTTTPETITARSVADATKAASANVSVVPQSNGSVAVSISPTAISVAGGASQQFSATVSGTSNTAVNWSVNGVAGGNATYGSISSAGLYTAPACPSASSVTVTATSAYDSTAKANSAVTLSTSTSSTTHFVAVGGNDSNDGSACRPWATIGKAARSVKAGDTVIVGDGTYPENVSINIGGTGESNRVVFRSQNKWGAHVSGVNGSSSTASNTFTVSANYVTIQDFEITGWDYTGYGIKEQNPAHHINVIGNNIHSMGKGATACVRGGGIGAVNYTLIKDNHIWDISIYPRGRIRCNYQHGIYVLGGDGGSIINNNIYAIWEGIGIQFDGARYNNWTVANNTIFNAAYDSGGDGGSMYFNCDGSSSLGAGTCDNNVWRNNIFANNSRYCWFVTSMNGGTLGANNVYDHNLTYNCGASYMQSGKATNQITTDPLFINYQPDGTGNYHLQSTSPARNGGTNTSCPSTDQDGVTRPQEGVCDIGSYEYH